MFLELPRNMAVAAEPCSPGPAINSRPFAPASRGWTTKDRTAPGHIGSPQFATADKGEALFQTFSGDVVGLLERVIGWDGRSWEWPRHG